MGNLTVTENGIHVVIKQDDSRIDSRIIAEMLDIQHESFIKTLDNYQHDLATFGVFRFQIGKPTKGSKGGRPERFAMLNEDQFIFAVTLSRNTPQVVKAKAIIVKAFSAARKLLEAQQSYLQSHHELHDTIIQMEAKAQQRGSHAPKGICHLWFERLNNKLLGITKGQRNMLTAKQKRLLNLLYEIEQTAANDILQSGGNEKDAYRAAKEQAQEFIRQYGKSILGIAS